jgi:hypothetical protein
MLAQRQTALFQSAGRVWCRQHILLSFVSLTDVKTTTARTKHRVVLALAGVFVFLSLGVSGQQASVAMSLVFAIGTDASRWRKTGEMNPVAQDLFGFFIQVLIGHLARLASPRRLESAGEFFHQLLKVQRSIC